MQFKEQKIAHYASSKRKPRRFSALMLADPGPTAKADAIVPNQTKADVLALRKELLVKPELSLVTEGLQLAKDQARELKWESYKWGWGGKKYRNISMALMVTGGGAGIGMFIALTTGHLILAQVFGSVMMVTFPLWLASEVISSPKSEWFRKFASKIDPLIKRLKKVEKDIPLLDEARVDLEAEMNKK